MKNTEENGRVCSKHLPSYRFSQLYPEGTTNAYYTAVGDNQCKDSYEREHRMGCLVEKMRRQSTDTFPSLENQSKSPHFDNFSSETRELIGSLTGFRCGLQLLEHDRRRRTTGLNWDPSHELEEQVQTGPGFGWRKQFHFRNGSQSINRDEEIEAFAPYPTC